MRKLPIALVLGVTVAGGAYSYYWFKQADELQKVLQQAIVQLNEQAKPLSKTGADFLRYESIVTSGFPFAIHVDVTKPVLNVPFSTILAQGFANHSMMQSANSAPQSDITLEISYSDKISLSSNILANKFAFTLAGDSTIKPLINNAPHKSITGTASEPLSCTLETESLNNLLHELPLVFSNTEQFLTAFKSIDCSVSGLTTKYTDSQETLSSLEAFHLTATSQKGNEDNQKITFKSDATNVKIFPAYDALINSYMPVFYELANVPLEQRNMESNLSQYGNQNSKIDIAYDGPIDRQTIFQPTTNLRLHVNAFHTKNDLYEANSEARLESVLNGDDRDTSIVFTSASTFNELYGQFLIKEATKALAATLQAPEGEFKFFQDVIKAGSPETVAATIVPKLHKAGKISFNADLKFKSGKDDSVLSPKEVTIGALDITTDHYGLKLNGHGNHGASPIPTGDLVIKCLTCDTMIDDIGGYGIAVDSLMAPSRPGKMQFITQPLVDGVKQFLHGIDEATTANSGSKDVTVHVVADDKGTITISGKDLQQVLGLFAVSIGQHLQRIEEHQNATQPNPADAIAPAASGVTPPAAQQLPPAPPVGAPVKPAE